MRRRLQTGVARPTNALTLGGRLRVDHRRRVLVDVLGDADGRRDLVDVVGRRANVVVASHMYDVGRLGVL